MPELRFIIEAVDGRLLLLGIILAILAAALVLVLRGRPEQLPQDDHWWKEEDQDASSRR